MIICPQCRWGNADGLAACEHCGKSLAGVSPAPVEPVAPPKPAAQAAVLPGQAAAAQRPMAQRPMAPPAGPGAPPVPRPPVTPLPPQGVRPPNKQEYVSAPQNSGMAIATLILGLLSCTVVALVLGVIALVQIGNSRGQLKGQGMAIAGMVCSIAIPGLLGIILYPVFNASFILGKEQPRIKTCISNQRQIAIAVSMYAVDNNEKLPADITSLNLSSTLLQCPDKLDLPISYGYNSNLPNRYLGDISDPTTTVLSADSNAPNHMISSASDIDMTRHHLLTPGSPKGQTVYIASFVDGHVAPEMPDFQVTIQLPPPSSTVPGNQ